MINFALKKLFFCFCFLVTWNTFSQETIRDYDMVIKNARIIDGTGNEYFYATLLISDDLIVKIDRDTSAVYVGKQIINAKGSVLTPGFIDTHSHGDPLETPEFENFVAMGVTTICLGQDGFSPAENDLASWMQQVNSKGVGVNIAMFAGHNTLRQLSGINYDSIGDPSKLEKMEELLQDAMDAGAFGMTTGLEYSPGEFSKMEELQGLAKIAGKNNGIIMSHMRNEDESEVETSINELLAQGKYCPVHISHIKVVYGKGEERAREIIDMLDSARASGIEVTADLYPYTASYTGIAILFPDWAKKPNSYEEVVKYRRDELADFLRKKVIQRNGPESTLLGTGIFKGKTLAEVASETGKPFEEVLIDDIGPYGAGAAHFIMDEDLQKTFLTRDYINICSDGSPTMRHPRSYGSFPRIIETYVQKEKLLSLEEAVYKMTGLSAKTIGLNNRGLIKEGYKADVLIFDPEDVVETATYENPHQLAKGMQFVIINGKIAKEAGDFTTERSGKILLKEK